MLLLDLDPDNIFLPVARCCIDRRLFQAVVGIRPRTKRNRQGELALFEQEKSVPELAQIYRASRLDLRIQARFPNSFAINQKPARSPSRVEALRAEIAVLIHAIPFRSGAS